MCDIICSGPRIRWTLFQFASLVFLTALAAVFFLLVVGIKLEDATQHDQLVAGNETGEDVLPVPWYRSAQGWLDKLEETSSSGGGSDPDVGFTVSGYPVITTVDCCPNHQGQIGSEGDGWVTARASLSSAFFLLIWLCGVLMVCFCLFPKGTPQEEDDGCWLTNFFGCLLPTQRRSEYEPL